MTALAGEGPDGCNCIENLICPVALNRTYALFGRHDEGVVVCGRFASLIETAKLNCVEPCVYLKGSV